MYRFQVFVLMLLIIVSGCGKPAQTAKSKSEKKKVATIESLAIPADPKPTIADADRPNSISAFVAKFHELHKKDVFAPFVELTYWGDMDSESKANYLKAVRQLFWASTTGKTMTIRSTKSIRPERTDLSGSVKPDGYMSAFPLSLYEDDRSGKLVPKATYFLEVQAHIDSSSSYFYTFVVGEHDGKFYFCTVK